MRLVLLVFLLSAVAVSVFAQGLKRTADPTERGYKPSDFPRLQNIAPNVYTYEVVVGTTEKYTTTIYAKADEVGLPDLVRIVMKRVLSI